MKAKIILNGKEYEIELTEEQVEEIEKPKYKRWQAKTGYGYWYMDSYGEVRKTADYYTPKDNFHFSIGNYFKTEEEADEYKKKLIYRQQYKDYIGEDIPTKEDWENNNLYKYVATYSFDNKKIIIFSGIDIKDESIYSKSEEKIKDFIKEIGEDNFKKYVLEVDDEDEKNKSTK